MVSFDHLQQNSRTLLQRIRLLNSSGENRVVKMRGGERRKGGINASVIGINNNYYRHLKSFSVNLTGNDHEESCQGVKS